MTEVHNRRTNSRTNANNKAFKGVLLSITLMLLLLGCASTTHERDIQSDEHQENPHSPYGITGNTISIDCSTLEWSDIAALVAPYQNDDLQLALMHQGPSSGYRVSAGAEQAMADGEDMPEIIKLILTAIVEAQC